MALDWPTLVTERLILRPWRPEDFAPYARFSADEEAMRYLGRDGRPTDAAETWRTICLFIGHWYLRGYTLWAVEERASGEFVGRVGPWKPEGWPAGRGRRAGGRRCRRCRTSRACGRSSSARVPRGAS